MKHSRLGLINGVTTALIFGLGVATQITSLGIVARLISNQAFGEFVLAVRIGAFATIIGSLGLDWWFLANQDNANAPSRSRWLSALKAVGSAWAIFGAFALTLVWLTPIPTALSLHPGVLSLALFAGFSGSVLLITGAAARGANRVRAANILHFSFFVYFLSTTLLAWLFHNRMLNDDWTIMVLLGLPASAVLATCAIFGFKWSNTGDYSATRGKISFGIPRASGMALLAATMLLPLVWTSATQPTTLPQLAATLSLFRLAEPLGQGAGMGSARHLRDVYRSRRRSLDGVEFLGIAVALGLAIFLATWGSNLAAFWLDLPIGNNASTTALLLVAGAYFLHLIASSAVNISANHPILLYSASTAFCVTLGSLILGLSGGFALAGGIASLSIWTLATWTYMRCQPAAGESTGSNGSTQNS